MPPPPIRIPAAKGDVVVPDSSAGGAGSGWYASLRGWLSKRQAQQEEQDVGVELDSDEPEQEQVCLSPLSQFFCNVSNPPDIYANMTLDGYCSVEEVVGPMQHMADLHDRFRRRLVFSLGSWHAEVLEHFDVRSLMREVTLDGPDAQQAYHQYMGKLMSEEPLGTHGLPPWDIFCIHYTCDPNRTDVLMRASHIIGDGQLFMKLIKQIMEPLDAAARADFDASITNARAGTPGVRRRPRRQFGAAGGDTTGLSSSGGSSASLSSSLGSSDDCGGPAAAAAGSGLNPNGALQQQQGSRRQRKGRSRQRQSSEQEAAPLLQQQQEQQLKQQHHHHKHRGRMQRWWKAFVGGLQWCWNQYTALVFSCIMLFWFADPVTLIKASEQQCNGPRRWGSITISLQEFHRVAKVLGHTLNTLAVTCLAGGVRRYLLRYGHAPARRIRMCGMVDTRSLPGLLPGAASMHGASNNFSFIGVPLYTGDVSPLQRLARVGRAMSWVRHSLVVPIALRMPDIIQTIFWHPESSSRAILRALPLKTTVGFSNMKGPSGSWSLAGYRVVNIHNGVQPMAFGSFISLFSYDRRLTFTHTCFETKTKSPEVLLDCILEEYHCLRKAAHISSAPFVSTLGTPDSSDGGKIKAA